MSFAKSLECIHKKKKEATAYSFPVEFKIKSKRVFMMMNDTNLSPALLGMMYPL
tara:strand:+ start:796 stop:957 length:162 start_codon:yes stop_codon:yes gene_type:complete